ncbi:hypothetical protein PUN28_019835 [Cardiocondyla obscurior]|uniref:Secreted protein n=1 Tax=Cardiocondyla obscurior TaxID=286306 RepID=A0AAW2E9P6_9HYME
MYVLYISFSFYTLTRCESLNILLRNCVRQRCVLPHKEFKFNNSKCIFSSTSCKETVVLMLYNNNWHKFKEILTARNLTFQMCQRTQHSYSFVSLVSIVYIETEGHRCKCTVHGFAPGLEYLC